MALKKGDKKNFNTLLNAAARGHLCVVESKCAKTHEYRALVCAVNNVDGQVQIVPLAQMITGNPYEDYEDPVVLLDKP